MTMPPRTAPVAHRVEWDPVEVTVWFDDGRVGRFNRCWLRDNRPSSGDRASLVRACSVADLPDDLTIGSARATDRGSVEITFGDGVGEDFPAALLHDAADPTTSDPRLSWRPFTSDRSPQRFDIAQVAPGTSYHHELLEAVALDGFALVYGLAPDATESLAALLGPIRETDFGRIFDIVSEPDPFTPSQSESALDPHTDDPYRYTPSGVGILHCVSPCSGVGGESVIVDGFAVAASIEASDPEAFALLTRTAVPYVHIRDVAVAQGVDVHLRADAPVIALDHTGAICGIRFHERSMAPLRLPSDVVEPFYRALALFARRVLGDEFAHRHRLAAGEAIVYDNHRVLHGRTAIDGEHGRRHLRLCTVDRDQVHSRLRRLRATHRPGTESAWLPAGSAS